MNKKPLIGLIVIDILTISRIMGYCIHISSQWPPPFLIKEQFVWAVLKIAEYIFWMLVGGLLVLVKLWKRTRDPQGMLWKLGFGMSIIPFPAFMFYVTLGATKNGLLAIGTGLSFAILTVSIAIYSKLK